MKHGLGRPLLYRIGFRHFIGQQFTVGDPCAARGVEAEKPLSQARAWLYGRSAADLADRRDSCTCAISDLTESEAMTAEVADDGLPVHGARIYRIL